MKEYKIIDSNGEVVDIVSVFEGELLEDKLIEILDEHLWGEIEIVDFYDINFGVPSFHLEIMETFSSNDDEEIHYFTIEEHITELD